MIAKFIGIGFHHIVSVEALDHLLFLTALAACYRLRDWRHGLTVVTADETLLTFQSSWPLFRIIDARR